VGYSQHGEDIILVDLFQKLGVEKPGYLDVGCFHPFEISNTALLYERGSRGINVDADHEAIELFQKHRPDDVNLCVGISVAPGEATFYRSTETRGCNSLVKGRLLSYAPVTSQETVKLTTMRAIVDAHWGGVYPDFLDLDIEGMDLPVLKTANLKINGPMVICVEAMCDAESQAICSVLEPQGYEFAQRCTHNDIYVRR
jgi:FkbM family methyltransferase